MRQRVSRRRRVGRRSGGGAGRPVRGRRALRGQHNLGYAVSAGHAASFYRGSAAATGSVEDEEGSASGFGAGLDLDGGGLGMSAAEVALALEEREVPPCSPGLRQYQGWVAEDHGDSFAERLLFWRKAWTSRTTYPCRLIRLEQSPSRQQYL
ncbi:hypothetical protein SEVIR_2G072800v4 [Setaria viridis]|uniref:Uncharacterized protein n=1 Tax=Setaria viridis TaxID=4556 RepID=A0A4U6VSW8_SETVI|nr:hypothetical protein SEVIR_2G072800v2 [Setaria viridis]